MSKEEALEEFFKSFKITLNTSTLYSKNHPYFIKPIEDLKKKADILFHFLNPIKIGITVSYLLVDGKNYDKAGLFDEIAKVFHNRKIESVEIKKGVTVEELVSFMSSVSLRPKEILRSGGIGKIMNRENTINISVEELDYSQLLKDEGDEVKDIWVYLLQEAIEEKNTKKINELADNLGGILSQFKLSDFLKDEQLHKNIDRFFAYLKDNQKDKLNKCSKEILKTILKEKNLPQGGNLDKIKIFLQDLSTDDLANVLLDKIVTDDSFDALNFSLLSHFVEEKKYREASSSFAQKLKNSEYLKDNPQAIKKIQTLFSASNDPFISEIFRHTLSSLLDNISFENRVSFNRDFLYTNYRFILINLLIEENDKVRLSYILEGLLGEWDKIAQERDWKYLKCLSEVLKKKRKNVPSLNDIFSELHGRISNFVQELIWTEEVPEDLEYFIDISQVSPKGLEYYLDKIFKEGKISHYTLKLFFKLFPNDLAAFYKNLELKHSDLEFLGEIIESLKSVEYSISIEVYKYIFSFSNELIKIEVLKAMQGLSGYDEEFLLSILRKADINLKKEALVVLMRDDTAKKKALEILLVMPNPWGMKNKLILENITIIKETGCRDAAYYLDLLSKKGFFWNRSIRRKAQEVLENWYVRKD